MKLGMAYYNNSEYKEAAIIYQRLLKTNPGKYDIYYNLGMTYIMLNDFLQAKENYEKAARINSYHEISNLSIGQINMILRDYDEAKKYFFEEKDSEDEKISAYSYYYLAKIALIEGEYEKAILYSNTALELYPSIKKVIESELRFKVIYGKIELNYQKEETKTNIKEKDENIIKYLENIYNKVDTLTDNIEHQLQSNENIDREIEK